MCRRPRPAQGYRSGPGHIKPNPRKSQNPGNERQKMRKRVIWDRLQRGLSVELWAFDEGGIAGDEVSQPPVRTPFCRGWCARFLKNQSEKSKIGDQGIYLSAFGT